MKIAVVAHCNSSRAKVIERENEIHVYTTKSPVNGEANKNIIVQLSKYYKHPKSKVHLLRGEKSKIKHFDLIDWSYRHKT